MLLMAEIFMPSSIHKKTFQVFRTTVLSSLSNGVVTFAKDSENSTPLFILWMKPFMDSVTSFGLETPSIRLLPPVTLYFTVIKRLTDRLAEPERLLGWHSGTQKESLPWVMILFTKATLEVFLPVELRRKPLLVSTVPSYRVLKDGHVLPDTTIF